MSTPEPNTEPAETESDEDTLEAAPGQTRRGISEWAVVLALVALIIGVAWSQFGSSFEASTQGTDGSTPVVGTPTPTQTEDGPSPVNTVRSRDDAERTDP